MTFSVTIFGVSLFEYFTMRGVRGFGDWLPIPLERGKRIFIILMGNGSFLLIVRMEK